ncbi:DNA polymerase Y family protein [Ferrovibrio terrae]|uniref:Y-family DNA polymerase n=1 Tax=Ferrovibrio terrae TaxID=2594003 RepID=UPI003137ECBE
MRRRNSPTTGPFALTQATAGTFRLSAVNLMAIQLGLKAGMPLADAMAQIPRLVTAPADPLGDQAALERLADWCCRWSPTVQVDGADGIVMDVYGVTHLFGGEDAMLQQMRASFRRMQVTTRIAFAASPAAAWAWSRYGAGGSLPEDRTAAFESLKDLPVAALRIDHDIVDALNGLGLKTIGSIANMARGPLAKRFGQGLLARIDMLMARQPEPITPRVPQAPWRSRANLVEPVSTRDAIDTVLDYLLDALCKLLADEHLGARQLALTAFRVDGDIQTIRVGTSYPSRSPKHLKRLFRDPLDSIAPGFGIESFTLEALTADPFSADQASLEATQQDDSRFAELIDRLQGRLGARNVFRFEPLGRHTPENAFARLPPMARSNREMPDYDPRPTRLISPEPVEMETTGDAFTWRRIRRRIAMTAGPERLHGEWKNGGMDIAGRDYFQVEDEVGRRYWLFRSSAGDWFMHGIF